MFINRLQKIAKRSAGTFTPIAYERKQAVIASVMNDYKSRDYNPRTAKYRSFKGVFGNS